MHGASCSSSIDGGCLTTHQQRSLTTVGPEQPSDPMFDAEREAVRRGRRAVSETVIVPVPVLQ